MFSEVKITTALKTIDKLREGVFWVFIDDNNISYAKNNASVVVNLTDRETISTLDRPIAVRSEYILEIRDDYFADLEALLDEIIKVLGNMLSSYSVINVDYDEDLEKHTLRASVNINE